jgi:sulfur-oxidizing protein SoxZ
MTRPMKMRARLQDGGNAELTVLIPHPMENGLRVDRATGRKIPAHFIQTLVVEHNGRPVATMSAGGGVSQDPLLGFLIPGVKAGDRIRVGWRDNRGESGSAETTVQP